MKDDDDDGILADNRPTLGSDWVTQTGSFGGPINEDDEEDEVNKEDEYEDIVNVSSNSSSEEEEDLTSPLSIRQQRCNNSGRVLVTEAASSEWWRQQQFNGCFPFEAGATSVAGGVKPVNTCECLPTCAE